MSRARRSNDWGFPRWRGYEGARGAAKVRLCDRADCDRPGACPAPKSPNSPDRWWFCADHAAEYNRGWNYFEGLSAEEAASRARDEARDAGGFRQSAYHAWGAPGDGSRTREELRALAALGLDPDADLETAKAAWRRLAKANHPDTRPGDEATAEHFRTVQTAWEVLRAAAERRGE